MSAIDRQRFTISRFGWFHAPQVLLDVRYVPDCMRQRELIPGSTVDHDRFLIKLECGFVVAQVALDLPESCERSGQINCRSGSSRNLQGTNQIASGILGPVITS